MTLAAQFSPSQKPLDVSLEASFMPLLYTARTAKLAGGIVFGLSSVRSENISYSTIF